MSAPDPPPGHAGARPVPAPGPRQTGPRDRASLSPAAAGDTLESLLRRGRLPPAQAVLIGIGVLAGLVALQRRGRNHGAVDTAAVMVAAHGQVRLTGDGVTAGDPRQDVMAAGRVICAALGVKAQRDLGSRPPHTPDGWLVEAARTIAAGGAGPSAANALVLFSDAAGRMAPGLRIQWTGAVIEKLAVPPPGAIAAAVDRFMTPPVPTGPAPVKPSTRRPTRKLYPVRVAASSVAERAAPRSDVAGAGQPAERTASSMPSVPNQDGAAKAPAARPTTWARVPKPAIWFALFLAVVAGAIWLRSGHPAAQPATGGIGVPSVAQTEAPAAGVAPDSVVAQYYELVMARNFDQAVALWDGDLRASLPPAQYPQQRFADTTQLVVNSAQIVSQDSSTATVAVDLTEVTGGVQHHWVGTWRVVKTGGAWLLDTPDFRAA